VITSPAKKADLTVPVVLLIIAIVFLAGIAWYLRKVHRDKVAARALLLNIDTGGHDGGEGGVGGVNDGDGDSNSGVDDAVIDIDQGASAREHSHGADSHRSARIVSPSNPASAQVTSRSRATGGAHSVGTPSQHGRSGTSRSRAVPSSSQPDMTLPGSTTPAGALGRATATETKDAPRTQFAGAALARPDAPQSKRHLRVDKPAGVPDAAPAPQSPVRGVVAQPTAAAGSPPREGIAVVPEAEAATATVAGMSSIQLAGSVSATTASSIIGAGSGTGSSGAPTVSEPPGAPEIRRKHRYRLPEGMTKEEAKALYKQRKLEAKRAAAAGRAPSPSR
jgi:hypothetical protein